MTKRLVDIDDEILEQAREALGTTSLKETINEALRAALVTARRRSITKEDIAAFAAAAKDLGDPEIMAKAWE